MPKAGDALIQRPLKTGSTVPLSQAFSWVGTLLAITAKNDKWDKGIVEAHPKVFCVNATAVNCIRWHNDTAFTYRFKLREKG